MKKLVLILFYFFITGCGSDKDFLDQEKKFRILNNMACNAIENRTDFIKSDTGGYDENYISEDYFIASYANIREDLTAFFNSQHHNQITEDEFPKITQLKCQDAVKDWRGTVKERLDRGPHYENLTMKINNLLMPSFEFIHVAFQSIAGVLVSLFLIYIPVLMFEYFIYEKHLVCLVMGVGMSFISGKFFCRIASEFIPNFPKIDEITSSFVMIFLSILIAVFFHKKSDSE